MLKVASCQIKNGFPPTRKRQAYFWRVQSNLFNKYTFLDIYMTQIQHPSKKEKLNTIAWLIEYFPAAFFKHSKHVKPLKIGIFDDIIDFYERLASPPFSKKVLREAINYYSSSPAYLSCQKKDTPRVDLYGNDVDLVTEEQAKYAYRRFQQFYVEKRAVICDKPEDS